VNRPAFYTTSRAVLAIAGAAVALAAGGCGGGASATSKQTTSKNEAPPPTNKLLGTVETSGQVALTTSAGRAVTRLRSGWYTVYVTVNAVGADFHLTGPSVDSATKSKVPGVALWGIHFLKGTYRYTNDHDAHAGSHVLTVY
jgi:hypothetical protein